MSSRRDFLKQFSLNVGGLFMASGPLSYFSQDLFNSSGKNENAGIEANKGYNAERKLGIALVGLGIYSTGQLAPALQETKHCRLAGIVTGSPEKAEKWKKQYNIPDKNIYNYQNFDSIKDNPDIDIVYVVLPNSMHAEYVIKAAQAGKRVITEKPMGISVKECEQMIEACKKAGKSLSVGYRVTYEPHNIEAGRLGQQKVYGNVKKIKADFGINAPGGTWRTDKEMAGGGPLVDLGIYCLDGAINVFGQLPVAVTAKEGKKTDPQKFKEVEESITWKMEFPGGGIAECYASYNDSTNYMKAEAEKGWIELNPAFAYGGITGKTKDGAMNFPQVNQQALQMDDIAQSVMNNKQSKVPGEMGLRDVKILTAIYEAARTGKRTVIS